MKTRTSMLIAATFALTAAGAVAANAATFGIANSAPNQTMIQHVHGGYGPHPHPHHGYGFRREFGPGWGPRRIGPSRCTIVRHECTNLFRPGGFRWERCVASRGC